MSTNPAAAPMVPMFECSPLCASGMRSSTHAVEYRGRDDLRNTPRKLAGLTKFGNVTLRWGVSDDSDFLEWVYSVAPTNTAPPTAWCGMLEGCRFLPAASAPA